ncbi:MAG TPA: hypothetical protein VIZ86_16700 [Pseudomonas sp.]
MDYYLKTETESAMYGALEDAGAGAWLDGDFSPAPGVSLSVLGECHVRSGGTDEDPIFSPVPGWHFNVRSVAPISWPAGVVESAPVTPWRVWG